MADIIQQLGLDHTYFVQLLIFAITFLVLSQVYFKPFLRLFEVRHQRTILDRKAAEAMVKQAEERLAEYQRELAAAKAQAKKDLEDLVLKAKQEEAAILGAAREEAKRITQGVAAEIAAERLQLKRGLEPEVARLATLVADRLLGGR